MSDTLQCDLCGETITADNQGQTTSDTVLCLDCCKRIKAADSPQWDVDNTFLSEKA